ncbi:MAG: response regulator [Alphaproteobacteria bacterium]
MARYDLSRLSILVAEDSAFMLKLFTGILQALGIERITTCDNGEEAIRVLSPIDDSSGPTVGMTGVDMILCDRFMPVVDGAMFLRWLRRSEKSPDRFLPVVMVSAGADIDVLFETRDAGVDEFLAKPFSANAVVSRIAAVIETPRPYIYCPTYFGPDRRRKATAVQKERRVISDDEIEVMHSGKSLPSTRNKKKRVWIFKLHRHLKAKLTTGNGDAGEPLFDPELIAAAEAKIAEMESDYSDWVQDSIAEMDKAHSAMVEDPSVSEQNMETIHRVALELRGQGGIFGYPLMTQFGKSLYETTSADPDPTSKRLSLIEAHIDLIKVVVKQKIKGDGGETGRDLLQSLAQAKKKFSAGH